MGTKSRLVDVVAATLDLSTDQVDDSLSSETNEAWDSVHHLMLILAVEEAFGIEFGESELVNLTNFPSLLAAVETRAGE